MSDNAGAIPWGGSLSPELGAEALAALASERPDLWPGIVRHPNSYPDLQQWIATQQAATPRAPVSAPTAFVDDDLESAESFAPSGSKRTLLVVLSLVLVVVLALASVGVALAMNKVWPFDGKSGISAFTAVEADRLSFSDG